MILILLAILPLIAAQTPAATFVGCASTLAGTSIDVIQIPAGFGAPDCAAYCGVWSQNFPQIYSYFQASTDNCYCQDSPPASFDYVDSSAVSAQSVCSNDGSLSVYRLGTTFVFDTCYITIISDNTPAPLISDDLNGVFTACRGSRNLIVLPVNDGTGFQYICVTTETFADPTPCGSFFNRNGFFVFSHDVASASQQLTRKRKQAARARGLVNLITAGVDSAAGYLPKIVSDIKEDYCPGDLTACKVFGSRDAYECIDTSTELESCGGCMYGVFGLGRGVAAPSAGVNCADLDARRSVFGGKTCERGQCVDLA